MQLEKTTSFLAANKSFAKLLFIFFLLAADISKAYNKKIKAKKDAPLDVDQSSENFYFSCSRDYLGSCESITCSFVSPIKERFFIKNYFFLNKKVLKLIFLKRFSFLLANLTFFILS